MSLASIGQCDHIVARRGLDFICESVLPDGSWPIDTNLTTWVTTLAINALHDDFTHAERAPFQKFLLDQQYTVEHPFTHAAPGGWAWTNLPGGVPDADDTPGAILALLNISADDATRSAVRNAVQWLIDLQNRDGGFPTFCRGWGTMPFDRSSPDISAHAIRAIRRWLHVSEATDPLGPLANTAIKRGMNFLRKIQRDDGSWYPLWFGNQHHPEEENPTYGTSRVLFAFRDEECTETPAAARGLAWLANNQNADGGWGGICGTPSTVEETSLAVEALLCSPIHQSHVERGLGWLVSRVESGDFSAPSPIGFYFAKLWYFEDLYPLTFLSSVLNSARRHHVGMTAAAEKPTRT